VSAASLPGHTMADPLQNKARKQSQQGCGLSVLLRQETHASSKHEAQQQPVVRN